MFISICLLVLILRVMFMFLLKLHLFLDLYSYLYVADYMLFCAAVAVSSAREYPPLVLLRTGSEVGLRVRFPGKTGQKVTDFGHKSEHSICTCIHVCTYISTYA